MTETHYAECNRVDCDWLEYAESLKAAGRASLRHWQNTKLRDDMEHHEDVSVGEVATE